jgi:ribosomal protein L17
MASFAAPFVYGDVLTALGLSGSLLRKLLEKKQSLEEVLLEPVEQLLKDKEIDRDWEKAIQKLSEDQKGLLILLDLLAKHLLDEQVYLKPLVEWLLENYKGKEKNYSEAQVIAKKIIEKIGEQKNEQHFIALKSLIQRLDAYGASSVNIRNFGAIIEDFYKQYKDLLFVGREDVIGELNAWLDDQNANPYLLLVALAGRGKSALLVHWLEELRKRQDLYLIFIPISARIGTNNLEAVKALAAFVANLCGEKVSTNCSSQQYAREIKSYLGRLGECLLDQQRVLIILDGLDEVNKYELFSNLFPQDNGQLGKLRVVVSARYLAGDKDATGWRERLGWPLDKVRVLELNLLDREAALAVIDHLLPGHPRRDELASLLYQLSDNGDPLLIKLYVDEINEIIKLYGADQVLPSLEKFKPGLESYFERWFEDLYNQQGWGDEVPKGILEILDLLSGALAPLSKNELVALSGMHTVNLEKALSKLARLIVGDGEQRGYVFSHPRLAQYFWEDKLTESQRRALDQKFLDWGFAVLDQLNNGKLSPEQVPPYLVRALGSHLARVEAGPKDWLRLMHPKWAEASELVGDSLGFFLEDLDRAWQTCIAANEQAIKQGKQAPYLGGEIRCALLKARLRSRAYLPPTLLIQLVEAGIWRWEYGRSYARQMPWAADRAEALTKLAVMSPVGAPAEWKLQVLAEALSAAREIDIPYTRAEALAALAPHLADEQKWQVLDEALAAAREIDDPYDRAEALAALAPHLADEQKRQVLDEALAAAREIDSLYTRAEALAALAPHLADEQKRQVLDEALAAAREIGWPYFRAEALAALAPHLVDEQKQQALAAAREIDDPCARAKAALAALAPHLVDEQKRQVLDEALAAARKIEWPDGRAEVLAALAPHLADEQKRQVLDEALAAARKINSPYNRAEALVALAPHLADEQKQQALAAAREIDHPYARAKALAALAPHLVDEQKQQALAAAREIEWPYFRAKALAALAPHLADEQKRQVLAEALAAAREIDSPYTRAEALVALAPHLADEQKRQVLDEALAAAREIDDPYARAEALAALAPHLVDEQKQQALAAAREIDDPYARAESLAALAPHLVDEQKQQALAAAREIDHPYARAEALAALAPHLVDEQKQQALAAAREIDDPYARAKALAALAPHLVDEQKRQVLDEALAAVREINRPYNRAEALVALAPHLANEQKRQVLDEALAAAQEIDHSYTRAKALAALAPHLVDEQKQQALAAAREIDDPYARAEALAALAPHLADEQKWQVLDEALAAARKINGTYNRAKALVALAPHLVDEQKQQVLDEALAAARKIGLPYDRAEVLAALAPHLVDEQKRQVLDEALAAAREIDDPEIDDPYARAEALAALALHLVDEQKQQALAAAREIDDPYARAKALAALAPHLADEQKRQVLDEALAAAREINSTYNRAKALAALAPHLADEQKQQALAAAREIDDPYARAEALAALAPHVVTYPLWRDTLQALASRTLPELLGDLKALVPASVALGGQGAVDDIARAILDLTR